MFQFYSVLLLLVISASTVAGKNKGQGRVQGRRGGAGRARAAANRKAGGETHRRERQRGNKPGKKAKTQSGCPRQTTTTFCPTEKALALKLLYGQVKNFFKQLKRAENHAKIVSKKKAKKADFESDAAILTEAVGGNISAPTCAS